MTPRANTDPNPPYHPRILLMIEPWLGFGREIISGVLRYAREHTQWEFLPSIQPTYRPDDLKRFPTADGIIFEGEQEMANWIAAAGKPAVNTRGAVAPGVHCIHIDRQAIARMALADLRGRGFSNIATARGTRHVCHMTLAFRRELEEAGLEPHEFGVESVPEEGDYAGALHAAWGPWLASLPKPVAVFCVRATLGRDVIFAAQREGLKVPEEVAVLALGPDDIMYEMCTPTVSFIDGGAHRRGWEAARLLDLMLRGAPLPSEPVRVQPRGIITQGSTDILAITDPELAQAVRIVRSRACEPVSATEILRGIPLSRRKIEMGFRSVLNRSIHEEIIRLRIDRARELLAYTSLPMPDIAERCGFAYASHLARIFKQQTGQSPSDFRREVSAKGT